MNPPSPHFLQGYILVRYVQETICSIWNQRSHRKKKKMEEAKERLGERSSQTGGCADDMGILFK